MIHACMCGYYVCMCIAVHNALISIITVFYCMIFQAYLDPINGRNGILF